MTEPITRSYRARRGDAWEGETFRVISPDGASFWSAAAVRSQIRAAPESSTIAHEFVLTPAVTTEGSNGVLTFSLALTKTESAALAPGAYVGDIEVESSGFKKTTICCFNFLVLADVTR